MRTSQNSRRRAMTFDENELLMFASTNESLDAIVAGLKPEPKDKILAICGSGDQPLALLENAGEVHTIDRNKTQVAYMHEKVELLRKHLQYKTIIRRILTKNQDSSRYRLDIDNIQEAATYFKRERLEKIRGKLDQLRIFPPGDIIEAAAEAEPESYTKLYISNILGWDQTYRPQEALGILSNCLTTGGLIYTTSEIKGICPENLQLDKDLTKSSQGKEWRFPIFPRFRWKPEVYRRVK